MKTLLSVAFLFLIASPYSRAQDAEKEVVVNFERTAMNLLRAEHHVTEIISLTEDEAPLGIAYRGLNYVPHLLRLAGGHHHSLNTLLGNSAYNRSKPPAIVRVSALTANQQVGFTAVRIKVELEADILLEQEDGSYLAYGPLSRVQMQSGGAVKRAAPREITELLALTILELSQLAAAGENGRVLPADELLRTPSSYPIQNMHPTELPNGVYHSYMDFRNGNVDTTHQVIFRKEKFIFTDSLGNDFFSVNFVQPPTIADGDFRSIWGIHFEGTTSVNLLDGGFYNLRQLPDGNFYTVIPPGMLTSRYQGTGTASAVGGILGGALGGLAAAAISGSGRSKGLARYAYDLTTGRFVEESR